MAQSLIEYTPQFRNVLNTIFGSFGTKLCNMLKSTNSIIAGGSILSVIHNYKLNDFDIYTNQDNLSSMFALISEVYIPTKIHISDAYCSSFMRKNNILGRICFSRDGLPKIDLMFIPSSLGVDSVVQNFDLSFCKIFFDGNNIYSFDKNASLRNGPGILGAEYTHNLLNTQNPFTIQRLKKYRFRGFTIKYDFSLIVPTTLFLDNKGKRDIDDVNEWFCKLIIKFLLTMKKPRFQNGPDDFEKNKQYYVDTSEMLKNLSWGNYSNPYLFLQKIMNNEEIIKFMKHIYLNYIRKTRFNDLYFKIAQNIETEIAKNTTAIGSKRSIERVDNTDEHSRSSKKLRAMSNYEEKYNLLKMILKR